MADEKFITTVEQRLTAVDETGDAFQKVIEKQEALNKSTEKGAEAVDDMAKKWAESEIKKKIEEAGGAADKTAESVGKIGPAAIAASVAIVAISAAIKVAYAEWKALSDAIKEDDLAARLHQGVIGFEGLAEAARSYKEAAAESFRDSKRELDGLNESFRQQKEIIGDQLKLQRDLIAARKEFNLALAGDDPEKKKQVEINAQKELHEAQTKAEKSEIEAKAEKARKAADLAEKRRAEYKSLQEEADRAAAGAAQFKSTSSEEIKSLEAEDAALAEEQRSVDESLELPGAATAPMPERAFSMEGGKMVGRRTGKMMTGQEYSASLAERRELNKKRREQLQAIGATKPARASALQSQADRAKADAERLEEESRLGFDEVGRDTERMTERETMFQRTMTLREGAAQQQANARAAKAAQKAEGKEIEAGQGILSKVPGTRQEREVFQMAAESIANSRSAAAELARAVLEDGQITAREIRWLTNEVKKLRAAKKVGADERENP